MSNMTTFMEKLAEELAKAKPAAPAVKPATPASAAPAPTATPAPSMAAGVTQTMAQSGVTANVQPPQNQNLQVSLDINAIKPIPDNVPISDPARQQFVINNQNNYTDDMWRQYMEDKTKLPAQAYDDMSYLADLAAARGRQQADRAVKANSGVLAGFRNGYSNREYGGFHPFRGLIDLPSLWLSRNYVDIASIRPEKYAPKRVADDAPYSQQALNQIKRRAFYDRLQQAFAEKGSTLSRQEHAAAHLEGSGADSTIGIVTNPLSRWLSKGKYADTMELLTGKTTSGQASEYGERARQDFGEEEGRRAEQRLRLGGTGVSAAGTALTFYATGGMGAGSEALSSWRLLPSIQKAVYMYPHTQSVAETLKSLGETATLGGKETEGLRGFVGDVANTTSAITANMPLYTVMHGGLGEIGHGISLAGKYTGMTPYVQKGFDAMGGTRLMNWLQSVRTPSSYPMYPMSHPVDTAWTMAKNTGKVMANAALSDISLGVKNGLIADTKSLMLNQKPTEGWGAYMGPGLRVGTNVVSDITPLVTDHYDITATAIHAGEGDNIQGEMTAQMIDAYKERYGQAPSPEMQQRMAEKAVPSLQWEQARNEAIASVVPGYNPYASTEERARQLTTADKTKLHDAVLKNARDLAVQGGILSEDIFRDENLTADDRSQILKTYMMAEVQKQHPGKWGKANLLLESKMHGKKDIMVKAMNNSDGMKKACTAYGQRVVEDMLNDRNMLGNLDEEEQELTQAAINALPEENLRQMLSPLKTASPEQLMRTVETMQQMSGSSMTSNRLSRIGTDLVKERLRSDGAFAKDFIMKYVDNLRDKSSSAQQNGKNPTKFTNMLNSADVNTILQNMDDGQFTDLAKWAIGLQGSMGELDEGKQKLLDVFTSAAKNRALDAVKRDPLKNLPVMTSLWLRSKGWEGMADLAENPVLFYGTAALLTGVLMFGGYDEDDNDDDDNIGGSEAVAKAKHQRELLTKEVFG